MLKKVLLTLLVKKNHKEIYQENQPQWFLYLYNLLYLLNIYITKNVSNTLFNTLSPTYFFIGCNSNESY